MDTKPQTPTSPKKQFSLDERMSMFRQRCPCLQGEEEDEVRVLDYRHCSLDNMPSEVFHYERTLEELYLDANAIRDLPRELFYCHGIKKLSLGDNELTKIPSAIASLVNLESLDISKNGIVDLPDNIKCCKYLSCVEASVNPLGKIPEGFTQLLSLTELYLNDTFLDYLPGSFGRLTKLKVLEIRENHLNTLPKSMTRLTALERLDIGNNDFTELPDIIGSLTSLLELWCDCNDIRNIPVDVGQLKQLMFLDASKNRIEWIAKEIDGCVSLADLYLSQNLLQQLPESIGRLTNLTTLRVDDNRLTALPFTIGGLVSLSELNVSANDLEEIPAGIGYLRHLRTLYADENFLYDVPPELGSCNGITVLSLRSNNLMYIPEEIGRIPRLRVLNLSDNKIRSLPYSLTRLKELQALWLSENQTKPMLRLQPEIDSESGQRMLTCYLLPQVPSDDREDMYSDAGSFHPSLWEEERKQRQRIHFDFDAVVEEECKLERTPTPYPKEMKQRLQHMRNLALKQLNIGNGEVKKDRAIQPASQAGVMGENTNTLVVRDLPSTVPPPPISPKPSSPVLHERHLLLKADKEKKQKDKARLASRKNSQEEIAINPARPLEHSPYKGDGKVKRSDSHGSRKTPDDDDGGFLSKSVPNRSVPGSSSDVPSLHQGSKPPSVLDLNANMSQEPAKPGSYSDFLKGLSNGNLNTHTQSEIPYRPPVPDYRSPKSMAAFYARSGYESDTKSDVGYRRSGYESDTRSDVGYRSDQEAIRHRRYHMARNRAEGYSSDMDIRRRSNKRETGYSSDMEMYLRGRSGHRYRPVSAMPTYSSIPENHSSNVRPPSSQSKLQPPPPNYSNAPFTKRTMLRNDELYEQYAGASNMSPHPKLPVKSRGVSTNSVKRSLSNNSHSSSQRLWPGSMTPEGSVRSGLNMSTQDSRVNGTITDNTMNASYINKSKMSTNRVDTSKMNTSRMDTSRVDTSGMDTNRRPDTQTNSSEEDVYKAQLYEASVKLQKTPSDRRKNSPQKALVVDMAAERVNLNESGFTNPPPYHPAPPYTPQTPQQHLGHREGSDSSPLTPQQSGGSMDSHEPLLRTPQRSGPTDGCVAVRTPQRTLNLSNESPMRCASKEPTRPSSLALVGTASPHPSPHQSRHDLSCTPTKPQDTLHIQTAVTRTPFGTPIGLLASPKALTSPRLPSTPHADSPMRLTQYEKDVAMYKQAEPASHVSSSTDSGYGHTHTFDRLTGISDGTSTREHSPASPSQASSSYRRASIEPSSNQTTPASSSHSPGGAFDTPPNTFRVTVAKNPGLGFSIAGGIGSPGNPFRSDDMGIFITKVQPEGPAAELLQAGDKILEVNGVNFRNCEHSMAVNTLRTCSQNTTLLIER